MLLHPFVTGDPERIAEREIGEQEPWHTTMGDYVERRTNDHGCNPILLQVSRRQTHGLMTDRSERNEKGNVRTILLATPEYFRRIVIQGTALTVLGWDAVETVGQRTQPS